MLLRSLTDGDNEKAGCHTLSIVGPLSEGNIT